MLICLYASLFMWLFNLSSVSASACLYINFFLDFHFVLLPVHLRSARNYRFKLFSFSYTVIGLDRIDFFDVYILSHLRGSYRFLSVSVFVAYFLPLSSLWHISPFISYYDLFSSILLLSGVQFRFFYWTVSSPISIYY